MSTGKIENVIIIYYHVLINYSYFTFFCVYIIFVVKNINIQKIQKGVVLYVINIRLSEEPAEVHDSCKNRRRCGRRSTHHPRCEQAPRFA